MPPCPITDEQGCLVVPFLFVDGSVLEAKKHLCPGTEACI